MSVNIPNNDFTEKFIERYSERVAIMSIDGGIEDAEEAAYTDTIVSLQRETGGCTECIPSLELCKAAEQQLRATTS